MKKCIIFLVLSVNLITSISAQTPAHQKSAYAIIDPVYNSHKISPEPVIKKGGASWIYGPVELESWRLQILRNRKDSAKLKVGYPGTYHIPAARVSFRLNLQEDKKPQKLQFRAIGKGSVLINEKEAAAFESTGSSHNLSIPRNVKIQTLQFNLSSSEEPPALLIEDKIFSTSLKEWEWKTEGEEWQPAFHFKQTISGIPPSRLEGPSIILKPVAKTGDLYDFGKELLGYLFIKKQEKPVLTAGESTEEALDSNNREIEQSTEMVQLNKGLWRSKSLLAFRYIKVPGTEIKDIQCTALFYPVQYGGAFACSDSVLTKVWMTSAYTLHLCMHDFLIDGIKRDRLPWTGDMAMSMMADAYAFGDPEIVRRSLAVLGRAGISKTDINGIIDYSLWWIIAQDHYQLYFGDKDHLQRDWPRIRETLNLLSKRSNTEGFLNTSDTWLFIDWVKQEKWTALQVLWWWAQQSGIRLAERIGDKATVTRWQKISADLQTNLVRRSYNLNKGIWLGNPEAPDKISRHANLLAVISGLAAKDQFEGIRKILSDKNINPVGTPYMAGFENMAISRMGDTELMMNNIRDYWGGMLNQGATSFWEAYNSGESGKERLIFYDRPYGRSLCHAWSAGPAAFLPSEILGLRPLEDGWKRFSVNPKTGSLKWVSSAVPTKYGVITVDLEGTEMRVKIPAGTIAEIGGKEIKGPEKIKFYGNWK